MSEDSILIVNYCDSDEKDSREHVYIHWFIFNILKFWGGEKKPRNLQVMPL